MRERALAAGAAHFGWKLGVGDRERIGGSIAVGHLTSATVLAPQTTYEEGGEELRADVELAVTLALDLDPTLDAEGARACVGWYATAVEIVDLAPLDASAEAVVATNVFHRAVALGRPRSDAPKRSLEAVALVDGALTRRASDAHVGERLSDAAAVLAAVGENLRRGDVVITGSIVQVPVGAGTTVWGEVASLGPVGLSISE